MCYFQPVLSLLALLLLLHQFLCFRSRKAARFDTVRRSFWLGALVDILWAVIYLAEAADTDTLPLQSLIMLYSPRGNVSISHGLELQEMRRSWWKDLVRSWVQRSLVWQVNKELKWTNEMRARRRIESWYVCNNGAASVRRLAFHPGHCISEDEIREIKEGVENWEGNEKREVIFMLQCGDTSHPKACGKKVWMWADDHYFSSFSFYNHSVHTHALSLSLSQPQELFLNS